MNDKAKDRTAQAGMASAEAQELNEFRTAQGRLAVHQQHEPPAHGQQFALTIIGKSHHWRVPTGEYRRLRLGRAVKLRNPVPRGHSFHGKADRIPVIADSR